MKIKVAKFISIISVVPLIAGLIMTLIFIIDKNVFDQNYVWYIYSLMFLTVIPLTAYPLKKIIPAYKDMGRRGERKLAFIMSLISYILGTIISFIFKAPKGIKIIFLTYLLSSIFLTCSNAMIHFKASGHACGVSGPLTLLIYFLGSHFWCTYLILPIVFWSRVKLKRHTIGELLTGALIGIFSTMIVVLVNLNYV